MRIAVPVFLTVLPTADQGLRVGISGAAGGLVLHGGGTGQAQFSLERIGCARQMHGTAAERARIAGAHRDRSAVPLVEWIVGGPSGVWIDHRIPTLIIELQVLEADGDLALRRYLP